MHLVDAHLDLAYNALEGGRDLTLPLAKLRAQENRSSETALVTLPELRQGSLTLVFGTIFTRPAGLGPMIQATAPTGLGGRAYDSPEEAHAQGLQQLELYERWEDEGRIRIVRSKADLDVVVEGDGTGPLGLVLLMENADPIRDPGDLAFWAGRGLRIVGPAWKATRYAGGTRMPGPLSELGKELVGAIDDAGLILDASHLAEESFWDAMDLRPRAVIASHSNARAITPTDRHLSDDMIRALGEADGVIGLVIANAFLRPGAGEEAKAAVTLADVRRHAEHIAGLIGWERLGIGTDFDGGFGVEETPDLIGSAADFAKLGGAVPDQWRAGFLGENWLRLLRRVLD